MTNDPVEQKRQELQAAIEAKEVEGMTKKQIATYNKLKEAREALQKARQEHRKAMSEKVEPKK